MVAESGAVLLKPEAKQALIERILPRAAVVTPNLAEARELTGLGRTRRPEELARAVQALGPDVAVVTGGHTDDGADRFFDGERARGDRGAAASRTAPRTAPAAPTPRRSRPASRSATRRSRPPAPRAQIAAEAVANGLREIGSGRPVDALGVAIADWA